MNESARWLKLSRSDREDLRAMAIVLLFFVGVFLFQPIRNHFIVETEPDDAVIDARRVDGVTALEYFQERRPQVATPRYYWRRIGNSSLYDLTMVIDGPGKWAVKTTYMGSPGEWTCVGIIWAPLSWILETVLSQEMHSSIGRAVFQSGELPVRCDLVPAP